MTDKTLTQIWNQVPPNYYQQGVRGNFFQRLWHSQKIGLAKKIINQLDFRRCIDVGCASGYMVTEIAKSYPRADYYGVDVYERAIKYARSHYPKVNFRVAAADKLPFKDGFFDLILFYETIEHVEDPKRCLRELKRVLDQDGTLIVTMDSGNWLFRIVWFIWENTKGSVWKGAHLHPFHHTELEGIIKKGGFKIKQKIFSMFGMEVTFVLTKR